MELVFDNPETINSPCEGALVQYLTTANDSGGKEVDFGFSEDEIGTVAEGVVQVRLVGTAATQASSTGVATS